MMKRRNFIKIMALLSVLHPETIANNMGMPKKKRIYKHSGRIILNSRIRNVQKAQREYNKKMNTIVGNIQRRIKIEGKAVLKLIPEVYDTNK